MPSKSSINKYLYFIKKYNIESSDDNTDLLNSIKNISTRKLIISAILWQTNDEKIKDKYRRILRELKIITDIQDKNHTKIHGYIPNWNDIIKKRDMLDKCSRDYLILSLYTYIQPRRSTDYVDMIYVDDNDECDDKHNYYVRNTKNSFVFNNFKTVKSFHRQVIHIPNKLVDILNNYIDSNDIQIGEYILNLKDYRQLYYILKKLVGCSVDNIRHSYISHVYKNGISDSNTIENNAYLMGHSLITHLRYRKNIM